MNIVQEVKKLELPAGEYMVFGSGVMSALGIKESQDIDLLVSPDLFYELKTRGWAQDEKEIDGRMRTRLVFGIFEAHKDFWYGAEDQDVLGMIQKTQLIEEIPFMSLEDTMEMKLRFGREKDLKDIELIKAYLASR